MVAYNSVPIRSGLEREDMQVFYNYLTTSLIPQHGEVDVWQTITSLINELLIVPPGHLNLNP